MNECVKRELRITDAAEKGDLYWNPVFLLVCFVDSMVNTLLIASVFLELKIWVKVQNSVRSIF